MLERKTISIDKIKPSPYNPRTITENAKQGLKNSIQKFGLVQEIVVNKRNMQIIGGHQRIDVLKELGDKTVPVVFVDLDDAEEKALNVALNSQKISGDFDLPKLQIVLDEIKEVDLQMFGDLKLNEILIENIENNTIDEKKIKEIQEQLQYKIMIDCDNEKEQLEMLEKFEREGIVCRGLIL